MNLLLRFIHIVCYLTKEKSMLTIGQAARLLGKSIDTLRNWEKSGKCIPIRIQSGQRRYTSEQINSLRKDKNETSITTCAVKISSFKEAAEKACSGFKDDEIVDITFNQKGLYNSVSIGVNNNSSRWNWVALEFEPHELLSPRDGDEPLIVDCPGIAS